MPHTVSGCDSCPFYHNETTCRHPDTQEFGAWKARYREAVKRIDGPITHRDLIPHPDWCPLLQGPVTIELEKQ